MSVIEELYLGNVRPGSDLALRNPSFSKVMEREEQLSRELMDTLNSNSKELFERFCNSRAELDEITQYDIFTYALKFGIMLMVEVFSGSYTLQMLLLVYSVGKTDHFIMSA